MLISGHNIYTNHICTCRGVKSGRHDSPYVRKSSLDHDSGGKNRGCQSVFQKYSTLLVFTRVTHTSPSLTASLAIIVPTRSPFFEISKSQKSESTTQVRECRDLTSLCLRLCIGVKLRAASGPSISYRVGWASPFTIKPCN